MHLLNQWTDRVAGASIKSVVPMIDYKVPKSPEYYAERIMFVETREEAENMVDLAYQRPLSHIGFDTEFRYDSPGVVIDKRSTVFDPRSIRPLLLSLAMTEPFGDGGGRLYRFVIDLRNRELLPHLRKIFQLPYHFCAHYAKVELFCLWKLGLAESPCIWDSFIFEKALHLGRYHHKYKIQNRKDEMQTILAKEEVSEKKKFSYSLVASCQRYGITYAMENSKERLQKSFLIHGGEKFSKEQIEYSAEDAVAAAKIFPLQIDKAARAGILRHCEKVEMDWVTTNSRIEWDGVRVDVGKIESVTKVLESCKEKIKKQLYDEYGICNIQSHKQLAEFFKSCGLLNKFKIKGKYSFDKEILKKNVSLHPSIPLLRAARRASDLLADKIMDPRFIGVDGRVHADHRQLGTDTGRQTSRWPNFLGLDRILRPLVIPEEGYGIGEVDWSQVEVGIAAAIYHDTALIDMFNSGDVYSAMAQKFFKSDLLENDLNLPGHEFKKKYPKFRNQMKSCTLGIIYGITPIGLAETLRTTKNKATTLFDQFMEMFPDLKYVLESTAQTSGIRGYGCTSTGLRRYREKLGRVSRWERNWLTNHPVQGSAAVVFKDAGNRLMKLYKRYDARIVIPLHDAFIFEAPMDCFEKVTEITEHVMCETLQEHFPELHPQVEANIFLPTCWNKDGDGYVLERWIEELEVSLKEIIK
ncbi:MAG: hypothetical protein HN472_17985 [Nitrospina sp.]|nr:hypothetical protein [Nitrospina sp.]